jgi:hypothetical protein
MKHRLWPISEAPQADYEFLRQAALSRVPLVGTKAARFERTGLAGLILRPADETLFDGVCVGASRPRWSPYADPRMEALSTVYRQLLSLPHNDTVGLQERG